jgi:hypothetical protein
MESGKAKQLLNKIQTSVEDGQAVPFATGKVLVDREEILEIVEELKTTIDLELKAYHEITDKRSKILKEAEREADEIIADAEETASRIRMSKPSPLAVDRQVKSLGKQEKQALRTANEIYAASIIYTNEMLMEINETVNQAYNMINMESERVLDSLRKKSETIENNKRELMEGLMDMKKQERYADILDISQLLANELYYEKNKAKSEEKENKNNEPEMVQWEFDFDDKKEPEPIKVKASRTAVKMEPEEDSTITSAFKVVKQLDEDEKKKRFADRTPVRLNEPSITDASAEGATEVNSKPDFRISGHLSDDFDDLNDGVV